MAKDITKELLEAIKATLPETQVGLIKEALNERDELLAERLDLENTIDELHTDIKDYKDMNHKLALENQTLNDQLLAKGHTLADLQNENKALKDKDVERRAELAEGKLNAIQETQQLFLKNTIVREKIQHQVVDEYPNMVSQYTPTGTVMSQQGTNKVNKPVTDIKENSTDTEEHQ